MAIEHPRPRVVVSRCLGFAACRYNGEVLPERFIDRLASSVDYVTVCPEVEIGMGTPRETAQLVREHGGLHMVGTRSRRDWTEAMESFAVRRATSVNLVFTGIEMDEGAPLRDGNRSLLTADYGGLVLAVYLAARM